MFKVNAANAPKKAPNISILKLVKRKNVSKSYTLRENKINSVTRLLFTI
jgi:hypothetical protein